MPKVKIPRKSTSVDMTAMCDVAFLLLSFFILATKQKPNEALEVNIPGSISAKAAPDEAMIITLTKEGKAYLQFGNEVRGDEVLENANLNFSLGLTDAEIAKWSRGEKLIPVPMNQMKAYINSDSKPNPGTLPGIPIADTANNELKKWIKAITNTYSGTDQRELTDKLLIKGDGNALYPSFKALKYAFKENELYKFRIITSGQPVPTNSELYKNSKGLPGGIKE